MCSLRDRSFAACSTAVTPLRVLPYPLHEFFLGHYDSAANFRCGGNSFMHEFIGTGRSNTQNLRLHRRVEEQRQIIVAFVFRYFHFVNFFWTPTVPLPFGTAP